MGYEIVYCASCQTQVRGTDLEKRAAIRVDDLSYCARCAPAVLKTLPPERARELLGRAPTPPPPIRQGSTSRIAKVQSKTSGRLKAQRAPAAPAPAPPAPPPKNGLLVASAAGVAVLVALAVVALSSGNSAPQKEEPRPGPLPKERSPQVARPGGPGESLAAAKALAELEVLTARPADPLEILIRCDEIKSLVRGTPQEAKWREIQVQATAAKKVRDAEQAVTMGLEQVRSLRKFDVRFVRQAEIEQLLATVKAKAGPRQADVQAVIDDYAKDVAEAKLRFRDLVAWYRFSIAERLGADDSGRDNNSLSVEGVQWNGSFPDGGPGARFSGGGGIAIPVPVRQDFSIAFWIRTRQAPVGDTQWFQGPGLVDAEVPGVVDDFGTALVRGRFAFGVGNPDVTLLSKVAINDGRWRHAAATRDSRTGEMKIYLDGELDGAMTGPQGPRNAPTRMTIGCLQTGTLAFVGELEDIRLYSRVLPDQEVAALARRRDGN